MKLIHTALLLGAFSICAPSIWSQEMGTETPSESTHLAQVTEPMSPRNIQILIEKDAPEALLEVKGPYYLINPHDGSRITSGLLGKRFIVRKLEEGLKWGEEFLGIHQFYIKPRSAETSIFVNGIQYDGAIAVFGVSGLINIINDVDIESYVKSTLTSQFSAPLEPEVLSSLAILARTNAYYHVMKNQNSFWHISAEEAKHPGCGLIVSGSNIAKAVDSTRHLILVHREEGKSLPFATAWTEHSAGKTAGYEAMFRKEAIAPEKGVEAPHAALSKQDAKWSYQISKRALAQAFGMGQIKSVEVFLDQPSNKVYGIRIKDGQETHDIDFFTLQEKIGKRQIQSSEFTVSLREDAVLFSGFGKGHGVGLCLYSASALAQNGENAVKILSKFFPDTYLYNLDATPEAGGP